MCLLDMGCALSHLKVRYLNERTKKARGMGRQDLCLMLEEKSEEVNMAW